MNTRILKINTTLPTLEGSPKQIMWGAAIRNRFVSSCAFCFDIDWEGIQICLDQGLDVEAQELQKELDRKQAAMNRVLSIDSASFYIDNRNKSVEEILRQYMN